MPAIIAYAVDEPLIPDMIALPLMRYYRAPRHFDFFTSIFQRLRHFAFEADADDY